MTIKKLVNKATMGLLIATMAVPVFGTATVFAENTQVMETSVIEDVGVDRIYGANRYQTSFAIADQLKNELGVEKFDTIIIASGTNFADALSGSYLAARTSAPILLIGDTNITDVLEYVKENLHDGGKIYILGGSAAVSDDVDVALNGYDVKRLKGNNRFETNLAILREAGIDENGTILIATGSNFADSLSASATGYPIMLVGDTLTEEQKSFLEYASAFSHYILGGTNAVSEDVENAIEGCERISGANRYETSVEIAKHFNGTIDSAIVAYGLNFPDGLCGGPLAYALNAPMILTAEDGENAAKEFINLYKIETGIVLGGESVLSDEVLKEVFSETNLDDSAGKEEDDLFYYTAEEIEERRIRNQAYRDVLEEMCAYQFGLQHVNGDDVMELLFYTYDPNEEQDNGPNYMYTYDPDPAYYEAYPAGKGCGVLSNMEYCQETEHFICKTYYEDGSYDLKISEFEGPYCSEEVIDGSLNNSETEQPFYIHVSADGEYYYGDHERAKESEPLTQEQTLHVKQMIDTYITFTMKADAPYAITEENLNIYLPLDDEGIAMQLAFFG